MPSPAAYRRGRPTAAVSGGASKATPKRLLPTVVRPLAAHRLGADGVRTRYLLVANQALSQLSYGPRLSNSQRQSFPGPHPLLPLSFSANHSPRRTRKATSPIPIALGVLLMGPVGVEPTTSSLSATRSNQLSYEPQPAFPSWDHRSQSRETRASLPTAVRHALPAPRTRRAHVFTCRAGAKKKPPASGGWPTRSGGSERAITAVRGLPQQFSGVSAKTTSSCTSINRHGHRRPNAFQPRDCNAPAYPVKPAAASFRQVSYRTADAWLAAPQTLAMIPVSLDFWHHNTTEHVSALRGFRGGRFVPAEDRRTGPDT